MVVKIVPLAAVMYVVVLASCTNANQADSRNPAMSKAVDKSNSMKSYISLFEIPANEILRAVNFYQAILDIKIETVEMPEMQMGIFPYEGQVVPGVIVQGEGYVPSSDGVTIYFDGGNDLKMVLDKVEANGGRVLTPKTAHADGNGYFAIFLDSEGNKMGLNSPN